ncbi:MAG TPA: TonB-dependent receptor plug domain-containing protein, partial [Ferruginibacter sp.]|nr:TonB-dependent receptor plug domain-containing protein [Ferruginibacter sp.]
PSVLGEVVMIAYGSARRKDVVGAFSTISGNEFENRSGTTPAELMQGYSPGVQVIRRNGTPGIQVHVMIRGSASFTSLEPLYIIDGIRSEGEVFNSINPQDIENITILKDASSTAIYGANGANGVVIITTKKGRPGKALISVASQWGIATPPKKYKLLNASEYLELAKEFQNPLPPDFRGTTTNGADWQDEIFRNALLSTNHVSISGGGEKMTYNISSGYFDEESVLRDFRYRSANLRIALQETTGRFKFGQNINFQYKHQTGTNDYGHSNSTIRDALGMPPYLNVKDASGNFTGPNELDLLTDDSPIFNPLARFDAQDNVARNFTLNPQFFAEVRILKSL